VNDELHFVFKEQYLDLHQLEVVTENDADVYKVCANVIDASGLGRLDIILVPRLWAFVTETTTRRTTRGVANTTFA
jgi:hypothetical protein